MTVTLAWNKKFDSKYVPYYIFAQCLGGFFAAIIAYLTLFSKINILEALEGANYLASSDINQFPTYYYSRVSESVQVTYPSIVQCFFDQ